MSQRNHANLLVDLHQLPISFRPQLDFFTISN